MTSLNPSAQPSTKVRTMTISDEKPPIQPQVNRADILEDHRINPYPHEFERSCSLLDVHLDFDYVGKAGTEVNLKLCGRVSKIRSVWKLLFVDVQDRDTELQFFLGLTALREKDLIDFKEFVNQGDWVGFKVNCLCRNTVGKLTAQVAEWYLLAPCLTDVAAEPNSVQQKRRQPDLHLATDLVARKRLIKRSKIVRSLRRLLEDEYDFLEMELPTLQPVGSDGIKTHPFLNTGAHSYLKRLGISGLDGIYGIHGSHHARQEGWLHTPEAQVLECFWSPADLKDMLRLTERMIMGIVREQCRTSRLTWQSHTQMRWLAELYNDIAADDALADTTLATNDTVVIDFDSPWQYQSVFGLVQGVTGVDFLALTSLEDAVEIARSVGVEIGENHTYSSVEAVALHILDELVIPTLIQPTFVVDYPFAECPWAKRHRHDPRLAENAELIINGIRFAVAYTEQNDPREYVHHIAESLKADEHGQSAGTAADDYHQTLEYGLPPTGGLCIDIDRLAMLITGATNLQDVIFFPFR